VSAETVRALEDLHAGLPPLVAAGDLGADLAGLAASPHYRRALDYFRDYPATSLMAPEGKALLYHLVRLRHARIAIEIGTYRAGTSEVLGRALWAEDGVLVTCDPNTQRTTEVERRLDSWPDPLRRAVSYVNFPSVALFDRMEIGRDSAYDFILVDGYHEYGYALFDMTMTAKHSLPGAVMVVDDFALPEVNWAARDFAAAHPAWRVIGDVFARQDPARPFETVSPSVAGTNFLVFERARVHVLSSRPSVFRYGNLASSGARGFDFTPAPGAPAGTLFAQVILRAAAPLPATPEQQIALVSTRIEAGQFSSVLLVDPPLVTQRVHDRECELQLIFRPDDGVSTLSLLAKPELIPA